MKLYLYGLLGLAFIFLMTVLGSLLIFIFKKDSNDKFKNLFIGFASGVMIAASIWSLLIPAIDLCDGDRFPIIPPVIGFILGCVFIWCLDLYLHKYLSSKEQFDISSKKRVSKLFSAVTLHNIPEGMSVGLAFGLVIINKDITYLPAAIGLAVGIGIQNFPEGAALALSISQETNSKKKGFIYNLLSGIVEPIFGIIAILFVTYLSSIMPYALSFAAGTMIYVVVDDLIPETKGNGSIGVWGLVIGFLVMMILDISF